MKPYRQGTLDGLCAVYGIVNATRIVAQLNDEDARSLFQRIIHYLEQHYHLERMLTEGVGLNTIGAILRDVVGDRITSRSMPFKHRPDTTLDEFWTAMSRFMECDNGRRAILIGLGGPAWDHWSVVASLSEKQIRFFDSHSLGRLNRSRCTTTRSTSKRPHVLCPTHTYFLS